MCSQFSNLCLEYSGILALRLFQYNSRVSLYSLTIGEYMDVKIHEQIWIISTQIHKVNVGSLEFYLAFVVQYILGGNFTSGFGGTGS